MTLLRLLPGPRLQPLLWGWAALALALVLWPGLERLWLGTAGLGLLALAWDTLALGLLRVPECRRDVAPVLPLGVQREVTLEFDHGGRHPLSLQAFDHHPAQALADALPLTLTLPPRTRTRARYRLRPDHRGLHRFPGIDLRFTGPLSLLSRQVFLPVESEVRVYPNFAEVSRYALLASDNRLSQLGIRQRRRRGSGLEFHQLREYRAGDSLRQIDWKATSRLRKLVSREYQDERDQQVLLLLDGGFRMRTQDGRLSHFDEALNALLLLAHVVQRQGDAVGLMSFANEERYLPPAKGHAVLARLMDAVFDLEAGAQTPDFMSVATDLAGRLRKRSLVVIITSLRDEDSAGLAEACKLLAERHLVLVANLRERVLDELDLAEPGDAAAALTTAATHQYLQERERALNRLRHDGIVVLDTRPDQLAVGLINRYLDIKRSGRL